LTTSDDVTNVDTLRSLWSSEAAMVRGPVWRVNAPKTMGAPRERARTAAETHVW
jgi:hypothetical protein